MWASIAIFVFSISMMFVSLLFFPSFQIGKIKMPTFFVPPLLGTIAVLSFKLVNYEELGRALVSSSGIGPIGIIVLFLSMSLLSIILDEAGFFSFIAAKMAHKAGGSQKKLFLILYVLVSFLTIFTSNDIVILTFTPFILFFSKEAKISSKPYLISEFVAANTWSMLLLIGNPTNIYLSSSSGLSFFTYLKGMWLPTVLSGTVAYLLLRLIFRKSLKTPFLPSSTPTAPLKHKKLSIMALAILGITTIMMAISSFVLIPMWAISLSGAIILLLITIVVDIKHKDHFALTKASLKKPSYEVAPFILSMFVLVYSLKNMGFVEIMATSLESVSPYLGVGLSSFALSNLLNNIPMSVFYSEVFLSMSRFTLPMVYLSIISSNIGAFFTPLGALAGLMWEGIIKEHGEELKARDFFKYLTPTSLVSLLVAFLGFYLYSLF